MIQPHKILRYNEEERKGVLSPVELAALFHYRYIRIHLFEDRNKIEGSVAINQR